MTEANFHNASADSRNSSLELSLLDGKGKNVNNENIITLQTRLRMSLTHRLSSFCIKRRQMKWLDFLSPRLRHVCSSLPEKHFIGRTSWTYLLLPKLTTVKNDPYSYSSGRWLKDDEAQRKARYVHFDFDALCQKAIQACRGASRTVQWEKLEGSFNRVFFLRMDNGKRVVARIPFQTSGPRRLVTNSEVATIAYCNYAPLSCYWHNTDIFLSTSEFKDTSSYRFRLE